LMKRILRAVQILVLVIVGLFAIEWAITFALAKKISSGNLHLEERLATEEIEWASLTTAGAWACKSYSLYGYAYHTCFRPFGDVYGYYFFAPKPYIGLGLFSRKTHDEFRYQTLSALGQNPGEFVGVAILSGVWERCTEGRSGAGLETDDSSYCAQAYNLELIEKGTWNTKYVN